MDIRWTGVFWKCKIWLSEELIARLGHYPLSLKIAWNSWEDKLHTVRESFILMINCHHHFIAFQRVACAILRPSLERLCLESLQYCKWHCSNYNILHNRNLDNYVLLNYNLDQQILYNHITIFYIAIFFITTFQLR